MAFVTPTALFVSRAVPAVAASPATPRIAVPTLSSTASAFLSSTSSLAASRSTRPTIVAPTSASPNASVVTPVASIADAPDGLSIASMVPNPVDTDKGNETITIRNPGNTDVSLQGWTLKDHVGAIESLTGTVPAGGTLQITLSGEGAQLKNTREEVTLINRAGETVNTVRYKGVMAPGLSVQFDVSIAAMLPNPVGTDKGNETVTLRNRGTADVSLQGWMIRDHLGQADELSGTVPAGGMLEVTLSGNGASLKNTGDDVYLVNPNGIAISIAKYKGPMAPGQTIYFD